MSQLMSFCLVLNIGSASQLSIINSLSTVVLPPAIDQVPYFHSNTLLVAASLTGGNAIVKLVDFFNEFLKG